MCGVNKGSLNVVQSLLNRKIKSGQLAVDPDIQEYNMADTGMSVSEEKLSIAWSAEKLYIFAIVKSFHDICM